MKVAQFMLHTGNVRLGVINGERIIDLNSRFNWVPNDLVRFLFEYEKAYDKLKEISSDPKNTTYPLNKVHILPPIKRPDKILGIALNYTDYCDENKIPYPDEPIVFSKFASTIIGPYDTIKYPQCSQAVDWEVELVVVIGREAKNVKVNEAFDYVFGYTATQDLTAKDWMKRSGGQFILSKNFDHFCPLGPYVVTKDELKHPHDINIKTVMTLLPGDVICTGSPAGVGASQNPPEFLQIGDVLETEVEGVGKLKNVVIR